MNKKKQGQFKETLTKLRAQMSGDYERTVESSGEEFGTGVPDINDEASRTISRRIMLEIGGKTHDAVVQIDAALDRIETGAYGDCDECGEDIPEKRLELVPYSVYCVECQKRLEKEGAEPS